MESLIASEPRAAPLPAVPLRVLSDERLARLAATGSQAAFTAFFVRHHQALHRYCHSIVGNDHDGGAADGGLAAAIGLSTQAGGAFSLAAKVATVTAVTAAAAAGGAAVYDTTDQDAARSPSAIARDAGPDDRRSAAASSPAPMRERGMIAPDGSESTHNSADGVTSDSSAHAEDTPGGSAEHPRNAGSLPPTAADPQPQTPAAEPVRGNASAAAPPAPLPAAAGSTPAANAPAAGATPPGMAIAATQGAAAAPGDSRPVTPAAAVTSGAAGPPFTPSRPR